MRQSPLYLAGVAGMILTTGLVWSLSARAAYETAPYEVIEQDGNIEIRQYPDLMLASVDSEEESHRRDGSFMKLFRYISGANDGEQKIAMTTPVFMQDQSPSSLGKMSFVLPQKVATANIPEPVGKEVKIRKRSGGRFAAIRFSGNLDPALVNEKEAELRKWLQAKGLSGAELAESAGYDAPFTPGPLRRNEVLIRLKDMEPTRESNPVPAVAK